MKRIVFDPEERQDPQLLRGLCPLRGLHEGMSRRGHHPERSRICGALGG